MEIASTPPRDGETVEFVAHDGEQNRFEVGMRGEFLIELPDRPHDGIGGACVGDPAVADDVVGENQACRGGSGVTRSRGKPGSLPCRRR